MLFSIDLASPLAIYEQVVRQMVFAVAAGALRPGEMVPSVREVARDLAINPNTVARAYRQLQDDGTLASVRGTGLVVAAGAFERCRHRRLAMIRQRFAEALREARQSRLDLAELRGLIENELAAYPADATPPLRGALQ